MTGNTQGNPANAIPVYYGGLAYQLLDDESATGAAVEGVRGGSYIAAVAGTFGGTSAQLQALGPDGATWINVGTAMTSAAQQGVVVGQNATVRMKLTGGSPTGMFTSLT